MRMNLYAEELTDRVEIIEKKADTGVTFIGVRFYLKSPETLHHTDKDDDQSGVTFWVRSSKEGFKQGDEYLLKSILKKAVWLLKDRAEVAGL